MTDNQLGHDRLRYPLLDPGWRSRDLHRLRHRDEPAHTRTSATATGTSPSGTAGRGLRRFALLRRSDPSVDIEKFTNGAGRRRGTRARRSPVGRPVAWTYRVTNTGNVPLRVDGDRQCSRRSLACPRIALHRPRADRLLLRQARATAQPGQYENIGTVAARARAGIRRSTTTTRPTTSASRATSTSRSSPTTRTPTRHPARSSRSARPVDLDLRGDEHRQQRPQRRRRRSELTPDVHQRSTLSADHARGRVRSMDCEATGTAAAGPVREPGRRPAGRRRSATRCATTIPRTTSGPSPGILSRRTPTGSMPTTRAGPSHPGRRCR